MKIKLDKLILILILVICYIRYINSDTVNTKFTLLSIESLKNPGYFFRKNSNNEIWIQKKDDSDSFNIDSSFILRKSIDPNFPQSYSFESVNLGYYIADGADFINIYKKVNTSLVKYSFTIETSNIQIQNTFSLKSTFYDDSYIADSSSRVILSRYDNNDNNYNLNSSWKFVLANILKFPKIDSIISFESVSYPKHYLTNKNNELWINYLVDGDIKNDSSFKLKKALNNKDDYYSFESTNSPGFFISHFDSMLWVKMNDNSNDFLEKASFLITESNFRSWKYFSFKIDNNFVRNDGYRVKIAIRDGSRQFDRDSSWKIILS